MFIALARVIMRAPWLVIGLWALVAVISAFIAPGAGAVLKPGGIGSGESEGAQGLRLVNQELDLPLSSVLAVYSSETDLRADAPEFLDRVDRSLQGLRGHPALKEIITYRTTQNRRLISPDGTTTYAVIGLSVHGAQAQRFLDEFRALVVRPEPPVRLWLSGGPAAYGDMEIVSHADLRRAEITSFPLAFIVLLVIFGSLVAAGAPVLVGGVSVLITLALIALLGRVVDMSIFVMNISTMLGLGIGIDYSLFIVSRFREELRRTPPESGRPSTGSGNARLSDAAVVEEAVVATMATAGRAVFFSGVVVVIGLAGLLTFKYMMLRSMGMGGALVVVVAVLAANTLLPAFLVLVGRRIDAFRIVPERDAGSGWWRRLANAVAARPWPVFLGTLLALLALGSPFLRVRLGSPDVSILPEWVESRQGFNVLWEKFGHGDVSPIIVVLEAPAGSVLERDRVGALYDFVQAVQQKEGVVRVDSIVSLAPDISRGQYQLLFSRPLEEIQLPELRSGLRFLAGGRVAVVQVVTQYHAVDPQAQRVVEEIRAMSRPGDMRKYVGGATAELNFIVTEMYSQFPRALGLIVIFTYLALLVLFGSVVLPLKAIIMNSLSILASYGALVIVFQDGYFASLLRFTPQGYVDATVPIVMFCVLFGLSMDYEVFMLSRIKEYYEQTGDNRLSVALGLERTGQLITSAALIVVLVSSAFALADILIIKAVGIGTALAILLDATVVRALLVPATMHILGDTNWWAPEFVRRLVPAARLMPAAIVTESTKV